MRIWLEDGPVEDVVVVTIGIVWKIVWDVIGEKVETIEWVGLGGLRLINWEYWMDKEVVVIVKDENSIDCWI